MNAELKDVKKVIPITPVASEAEPELVSLYAAHEKIYPRSVTGVFTNWRWIMVWVTQIIFYGLPWVEWGQRQAVLFDLEVRRFYIFGLVLYPQDFIYLTGMLIISALSLFLFTAVAGRLWCGYACPQTVYTEIFLWIEKLTEGDRSARMRRDGGAMTAEKFGRKTAKHLIWLLFGLWTGFTFVGYFTPIQTMVSQVSTLDFGPWETFWVLFYGFATYGNAGFMREQVCKHMCPYARFQSVMFDKDTLIVTYDAERGEPRGARSKKADPTKLNLGACVDCSLCVQVCPTGIDIRNGLQYECIGCGACADVCDTVMDKVGYPRGLISYTTEHNLSGQKTQKLRPRLIGYALVLLTMMGLLAAAFFTRTLVGFDVSKDRVLYRENAEGRIENVYSLKIMNKDQQDHTYVLDATGLPDLKLQGKREIKVAAGDIVSLPVELSIAPEKLPSSTNEVFFILKDADNNDINVKAKSRFIGPQIR